MLDKNGHEWQAGDPKGVIMDYGDFQHILDELNGLRAARRPNGEILMHYGDINDPDDPRWQVIDRDVAENLMEDIDFVLNDERMKHVP